MEAQKYEYALQLYEQADLSDSTDEADRVRKMGIDILKNITTKNPELPEFNYAIGYGIYMLNQQNNASLTESINYFKNELIINPKHNYARLYLGHSYFDNGNYSDALVNFRLVNGQVFTSHDQQWRNVKLEELILCCMIYTMHPCSEIKSQYLSLRKYYIGDNKLENIDLPVLSELKKASNYLLNYDEAECIEIKNNIDQLINTRL